MNLDRPGLFEGQKLLLATVTDVESKRVEKLSDNQVKDEIYNVLRKVYPTASRPSGKLSLFYIEKIVNPLLLRPFN